MISPLLLSAFVSALPAAPPPWEVAPLVRPAGDAEFDRRLKASGKDLTALWELVTWCEDTDREKEIAKVLRAVVRLDEGNRRARQRLGHVEYEGQWFTTQKKVEDHKKKVFAKRAKELGYVKYRGEYVDPADLPFLQKGYVKGPDERWITKQQAELAEAGWVRQDLVWVSPEEIPKIEEGLWKCGDEWLTAEGADRYHRRLDVCWVVPTRHLTVSSTCSRATVEASIEHMHRAYDELLRIFGSAPRRKLPVLLMRTNAEYLVFCTKGALGQPPAEERGFAKQLRSTYAESWFDPEAETWLGTGATFWNASEEHGDKFGVHDARMAMGLSFVDAMDPSPQAVAKLEKRGPYGRYAADFQGEKKLPPWFAWGAACYAARYYEDTGDNRWWAREWSVQNLVGAGGAPPLSTIFRFDITAGDSYTRHVVNAAGLLVAFVLDGGCAPVQEVHEELKTALKEGRETRKIFDRLRKAIEEHESELDAFAGL